MLSKVKNIEVLFITRDHYENPWLLPFPFQTYRQGALNVKDQIDLHGSTALTSYERKGHMEAFKALNIKAYPTIIFIDKSTNRSLVRLEGVTEITANSVSSTLLYLNGLLSDGEGNYFKKDGTPVFTSPLGLGLFNVPVPRMVYLLSGAILGYKAYRSKSKPAKYGYGVLATRMLFKYFNG